jgi:hypothetical protein
MNPKQAAVGPYYLIARALGAGGVLALTLFSTACETDETVGVTEIYVEPQSVAYITESAAYYPDEPRETVYYPDTEQVLIEGRNPAVVEAQGDAIDKYVNAETRARYERSRQVTPVSYTAAPSVQPRVAPETKPLPPAEQKRLARQESDRLASTEAQLKAKAESEVLGSVGKVRPSKPTPTAPKPAPTAAEEPVAPTSPSVASVYR